MTSVPAGKTKAIIAYCTFIGFFIAISMNKDKPEEFATFHIKNMFGITLMFIVSLVVQAQIDVTVGDIIWLICLLLWLFCWSMAFFSKKRGIPFLSEKFQEWFTFLN